MISYLDNGNKFNFRVAGVILNEDRTKILLHRFPEFKFWLLPGGRVEMLEDTKTSLAREISEEIGAKAKVEDFIINSETFFNYRDAKYHEIGYYYLVKLEDEKFYNLSEFKGVEGEKTLYYKWFAIEDLDKITVKPEFLKSYLQEGKYEFKHIIKSEL